MIQSGIEKLVNSSLGVYLAHKIRKNHWMVFNGTESTIKIPTYCRSESPRLSSIDKTLGQNHSSSFELNSQDIQNLESLYGERLFKCR